MYGASYGAANQNSMAQMNMMNQMSMMNQMNMMNMGMMNPNIFIFTGNSLSLQSRLDALTDSDCQNFIDSNVTVVGTQLRSINMMSLLCTMIWGSLFFFPLCFMCCDWWKKCTYPGYSVSTSVYAGFAKLLRSPNLRNITITVYDNLFNQEKANILYNAVAGSQLRGFTFRNLAGAYDYEGTEYSHFEQNMRPIKTLNNVTSDIRWNTTIVSI